MNKKLVLVLAFQFFLLLSVIKPDAMLWWDECTQLLLARTALQNPLQFHDYGVVGWHVESGKAHLFPWTLALLGANQGMGIITNAILSLIVSFLVFKIAEKEFGETAAFFSVMIMLSFVDPFLLYSVKLYNHILAIALSLLSVYLMQNGRRTASAIAFGFSLISRYDTWVTAGPLVYLLVKESKKNWKTPLKNFFLISIAIASIQFIISDTLEFGTPFASFIYERGIFLGIPPVNQPLYYFWRFFGGNPMAAVFLVAGSALAWKRKKWAFLLWLASALIFWELLTPFKSLRFLITLLPIFSPIAAFGFVSLTKNLPKAVATAAIFAFIVYSAFLAVSHIDFVKYALADDDRLRDIADHVGNKTVITNAFSPLACYSDAKVLLLPSDEAQFRKMNYDYLLIYSESFKPDYLGKALLGLQKTNYRSRTFNSTAYEEGTMDLYVRSRPSASP